MFEMFIAFIAVILTLSVSVPLSGEMAIEKTTGVICREAYKAKLEQQIPTCKEWIDGGLK